MTATLLIQIVLSGLVTGLIYMLIALGVTLLFGIMRVVNFVHGELVMLSAFAIWFIGADQGWHRAVDTSLPSGEDFLEAGQEVDPPPPPPLKLTMTAEF